MSNGNLHGPLRKQISSLGSHTWFITSNLSQSSPTSFGNEPSPLIYPDISNQKLQEHINITFNKCTLQCWGSLDHLWLPNLTALPIWYFKRFIICLCSDGTALYVSFPSICSICTMFSIKESVSVLPSVEQFAVVFSARPQQVRGSCNYRITPWFHTSSPETILGANY